MDNVIFLFAGLIGLWIGTELIVNGAIELSKRFHVKETFIGLSILAIGTDLPEISIMLDVSLFKQGSDQYAGIVLGSTIGSAIGQITFVLGIVSLIGSVYVLKSELTRLKVLLISATVLLFVFVFDGIITRTEGAILTLCYGLFFYFQIKERKKPDIIKDRKFSKFPVSAWFMVVSGFILLLGNSELTVKSAISLAQDFGLSQSSVAVVIIGLGSSLPELSLSIFAIIRKKIGLSIGNLLGSNILDTLLIPGVGAMIAPLHADKEILWFDMPFLMFATLLAFVVIGVSKKNMQRPIALLLILSYVMYILFRFGRELFLG